MQTLRLLLLSILSCNQCSRNLTIRKLILRQPQLLGEKHGIRSELLVICHTVGNHCRYRSTLWQSTVRHTMRTPKCTKSSTALLRKTLTRWGARPSNRCCSHSRSHKSVELPLRVHVLFRWNENMYTSRSGTRNPRCAVI